MLGTAGIGAVSTLSADSYRPVLAIVGLIAVLLLAVGLAVPMPSLIPWPLAILGGMYAWTLGGGAVDQWAPVYAGGFLAVAEIAYWSIALRGRAADSERLAERRMVLIATLALVSVALGGLVLAATSLSIGSGIAIDLLGVAAAVGAVAAVAAVAHRRV